MVKPWPIPTVRFRPNLWIQHRNGREVPTGWTVQLDDRGVDVDVYAINPQAWMTTSIPYWEGPVIVEGSHQGRGYLEMTGYD